MQSEYKARASPVSSGPTVSISQFCVSGKCEPTCQKGNIADAFTPEKLLAWHHSNPLKLGEDRSANFQQMFDEIIGHRTLVECMDETQKFIRSTMVRPFLAAYPPPPLSDERIIREFQRNHAESKAWMAWADKFEQLYPLPVEYKQSAFKLLNVIRADRRAAKARAFTPHTFLEWLENHPYPLSLVENASISDDYDYEWEECAREEVLGDADMRDSLDAVQQLLSEEANVFVLNNPAPSLDVFENERRETKLKKKRCQNTTLRATKKKQKKDLRRSKQEEEEEEHDNIDVEDLEGHQDLEDSTLWDLNTSQHPQAIAFRKWADQIRGMGTIYTPFRSYDIVQSRLKWLRKHAPENLA